MPTTTETESPATFQFDFNALACPVCGEQGDSVQPLFYPDSKQSAAIVLYAAHDRCSDEAVAAALLKVFTHMAVQVTDPAPSPAPRRLPAWYRLWNRAVTSPVCRRSSAFVSDYLAYTLDGPGMSRRLRIAIYAACVLGFGTFASHLSWWRSLGAWMSAATFGWFVGSKRELDREASHEKP